MMPDLFSGRLGFATSWSRPTVSYLLVMLECIMMGVEIDSHWAVLIQDSHHLFIGHPIDQPMVLINVVLLMLGQLLA